MPKARKPKKIYEEITAGVTVVKYKQAVELLGLQVAAEEKPFEEPFTKICDGRTVVCTNNTKNRPFNQKRSIELALIILSNQWVMNGEPIIVGEYGQVLNGQHRLFAIVFAYWMIMCDTEGQFSISADDLEIQTFMVLGISEDPKVVNTMDTGRRRSTSDAIIASGLLDDYKPSKGIAKLASKGLENCLRWLWPRIHVESESFTTKRNHLDSIQFLRDHPRLIELVVSLSKVQAKKRAVTEACGIGSFGLVCGLAYLMATNLTDPAKYNGKGETCNYDAWDKSFEFWMAIAESEKIMLPMNGKMGDARRNCGGFGVDYCMLQLWIQAWKCFSQEDKIDKAKIKLRWSKPDEDGFKTCLTEEFIGGLDYERG